MRRVFRKHIFPHKLKRGLLTEASLFISLAVLYLMLLGILASLLYQEKNETNIKAPML